MFLFLNDMLHVSQVLKESNRPIGSRLTYSAENRYIYRIRENRKKRVYRLAHKRCFQIQSQPRSFTPGSNVRPTHARCNVPCVLSRRPHCSHSLGSTCIGSEILLIFRPHLASLSGKHLVTVSVLHFY